MGDSCHKRHMHLLFMPGNVFVSCGRVSQTRLQEMESCACLLPTVPRFQNCVSWVGNGTKRIKMVRTRSQTNATKALKKQVKSLKRQILTFEERIASLEARLLEMGEDALATEDEEENNTNNNSTVSNNNEANSGNTEHDNGNLIEQNVDDLQWGACYQCHGVYRYMAQCSNCEDEGYFHEIRVVLRNNEWVRAEE